MAIQTRRGNYGDFDPQKMLPGEWATTISGDPNAKDGRGVYMCFAAGDVKRMATYEDMKDNVLEASEDVIKEVAEGLSSELTDATDNANTATQKATQAAQGAKQAKADADSAAKSANDAAELANKAAENVKNDYYGSYDSFPKPGQTNKLYIDNTVTPAKQYIWNGNEYILAGGGGGDVNAESVSYDNASSGLAANTVQGAIDENAADIKAINAKKMSYVSYVNTRTEPLTTNDASYIVLDTQKAFLNKGVYAITVFGTISSSGGTAQLRVVFDGGERGFAQNTQNIYNSCSETILYEVSESNEYTFEFSLGCNVNKATLYPYVNYGYSIFQIY